MKEVYIAIGILKSSSIASKLVLGVYTCRRAAYLNQDHDKYLINIEPFTLDNSRLPPMDPEPRLIKGCKALRDGKWESVYTEPRDCMSNCKCKDWNKEEK